ncbi:MAG: leucine-rich repeat protein [Lachnospiraceae bacterium]|nr:leucine-rich repeat protein [Lachnospiraceae bacterium]
MRKTSKFLALFLTLALAFSLLPAGRTALAAGSYSGTCGDGLSWTLASNGIMRITGTGAMTDYSQSDKAPWYDYREQIKIVDVESGVTGIGAWAFRSCTNLTEVNLPRSLRSLGARAFVGCSSLGSVNIPEGVTGIGVYAFASCSSLSWVRLPQSLQSVDESSFLNVNGLSDVYYNGSEEEWTQLISGIGNSPLLNAAIHYNGFPAFGLCGREYRYKNLQWYLDEEGNMRISGTGQMENFIIDEVQPWLDFLDDIQTLTVEEGVTTIGRDAFENCVNLREVKLPDSLSVIGDEAFMSCSSLKKINIPGGITNLSDAFMYCSSLEKIIIPSGQETITSRAFEGCSGLKSVTIPVSVTEIRYYAFEYCTSLTDVYYAGTEEEWNQILILPNNEILLNTTVHFNAYEPGWQKIDGKWHYYDGNGAAVTGWQKIGGKWYYFNAEGVMQTFWQKINGKWYYLGAGGAMVTDWQKINGKWYYFNAGGAMQTGWQKIGGKWYYLESNGAMVTGWKTIGGKTYFFKTSGAMAAKEWCGGWWLNADGTWTYPYKATWRKNAKGWWFGDESGWYAKSCTITIDGKSYTFDAQGYLK